ncbi:MAG: YbaK/EbsC family protein [Alphaproteobacteria bacterium]|jgi:prolyl-tRNA editing enzyme YbaK/EbsC (Cys-tRNA(Pro) deacylase)|nr:YbaK/EbsC family protein [Alphaproteobacteria bacterium]
MMRIETEATNQVKAALDAEGMADRLRVLDDTARSAEDAAASLGVAVEAIVKTLIFEFVASTGPLSGQVFPIAALISGDRQCDADALAKIMAISGDITGEVRRPNANRVKAITGYSIGGVSPVGLPDDVLILIDSALSRSDQLWAAAGHPHVVFGVSFSELQRLTGGRVTGEISV